VTVTVTGLTESGIVYRYRNSEIIVQAPIICNRLSGVDLNNALPCNWKLGLAGGCEPGPGKYNYWTRGKQPLQWWTELGAAFWNKQDRSGENNTG
jgi:hypothetical protein